MKYVLIVDDNHRKMEALKKALARIFSQAEIQTFGCSNDFLVAVRYTHKSGILREPGEYLMVIDMQMPPMDGARIDANAGYAMLNELRRLQLRCPAVIASSEDIDEERAQGMYAGYKGFVRYSMMFPPMATLVTILGEYIDS